MDKPEATASQLWGFRDLSLGLKFTAKAYHGNHFDLNLLFSGNRHKPCAVQHEDVLPLL